MSFQNKLKSRRVAMGLTQAQVADILNVKVRRYAYWEKSSCPPLSLVPKICQVFETTPNQLFDYDEKKSTETKARIIADAIADLVESG